jgi:hypothetical protein
MFGTSTSKCYYIYNLMQPQKKVSFRSNKLSQHYSRPVHVCVFVTEREMTVNCSYLKKWTKMSTGMYSVILTSVKKPIEIQQGIIAFIP